MATAMASVPTQSWGDIRQKKLELFNPHPRTDPTTLHFWLQDADGTWSAQEITIDKAQGTAVPTRIRCLYPTLSLEKRDKIQLIYNRLGWQLQALGEIQRILPYECQFYHQAPGNNILDELTTHLAPLLETPTGRKGTFKKYAVLSVAQINFDDRVLEMIIPLYKKHGFVVTGRSVAGESLCDILTHVFGHGTSTNVHILCCRTQDRLTAVPNAKIDPNLTMAKHIRNRPPFRLTKWVIDGNKALTLPVTVAQAQSYDQLLTVMPPDGQPAGSQSTQQWRTS